MLTSRPLTHHNKGGWCSEGLSSVKTFLPPLCTEHLVRAWVLLLSPTGNEVEMKLDSIPSLVTQAGIRRPSQSPPPDDLEMQVVDTSPLCHTSTQIPFPLAPALPVRKPPTVCSGVRGHFWWSTLTRLQRVLFLLPSQGLLLSPRLGSLPQVSSMNLKLNPLFAKLCRIGFHCCRHPDRYVNHAHALNKEAPNL